MRTSPLTPTLAATLPLLAALHDRHTAHTVTYCLLTCGLPSACQPPVTPALNVSCCYSSLKHPSMLADSLHAISRPFLHKHGCHYALAPPPPTTTTFNPTAGSPPFSLIPFISWVSFHLHAIPLQFAVAMGTGLVLVHDDKTVLLYACFYATHARTPGGDARTPHTYTRGAAPIFARLYAELPAPFVDSVWLTTVGGMVWLSSAAFYHLHLAPVA